MPFARDQHKVARPGFEERRPDGRSTVRDHVRRAPFRRRKILHALFNIA